jgi:hypothetical protein
MWVMRGDGSIMRGFGYFGELWVVATTRHITSGGPYAAYLDIPYTTSHFTPESSQ